MTAQPSFSPQLSARDSERRIKLARFAAIITSVICLLWCLIFLALRDIHSTLIIAFASWPTWLACLLYLIGFSGVARSLWLILFPATYLITTLHFSTSINPELIFFCMIGAPFLFYSAITEKRQLWSMVAYQCLITLCAMGYDRFGSHEWFLIETPPAALPPASVDFGVRLTVTVVLLTELYCFSYLARLSTEEAEAALQDAQAATRSRGEFLANMSHEIRTPMNGMIGMIEVMETMDEDKRHARSIGMIRNSAFSLLRILDDILDASQIDSGKLRVERTKVEVRPLAEGAAQTMQSMADTLEVDLRMLVHPDVPEWIWSDSGRLRQILLNLLSNAVKYSAKRLTGRRGQVMLNVFPNARGGLGITISDNGTGISDEVRRNLFQPFAEGESTSRRMVGGTGLGLSITHSLVQLLGGSITVEKTDGPGTMVCVDLPIEIADGPIRTPSLKGIQIVIFDVLDNAVRSGLTTLLERGGATLHFVCNTNELKSLLPLSGPEPVFLFPTPDEEQADALQRDLETLHPNPKVVRFSASRAARYGLQTERSYLIQIFPMMGSELLRALAGLGGTLTLEEASPHRSVTTVVPTAAPSILEGNEQRNTPRKAKILLVEDNEINRMVMSKQLEIIGYDHEMAVNGQEGLAAWRTGRFDLILSDCHMPILDGFEMAQQIRADENATGIPQIPIIAVTANALDGEKERCQAHGMNGYLAKPVEIEKLKSIIKSHLSDSPREP